MSKAVLFFAFTHYGALAGLALCAYVFGCRALRRFRFGNTYERIAFTTTLGLGLIAQGVFLLGLLRGLYPVVLVSALLLGLVFCHSVWRQWPQESAAGVKSLATKASWRWLVGLGLAVLSLWWFQQLWQIPLYPPTAFDATVYHLPLAKLYAREHQLVYAEYFRVPVFPQNVEMLFTLALLLYDDILAQLLETLMLGLVACSLLAWGNRFLTFSAGAWACAYLLLNPLILWLAGAAYIDLGLMAFCFLACYAIEVWRRCFDPRWLVLAGVFAGCAVGTKYTALFIVLVLTLTVTWFGWQKLGRAALWQCVGRFAGVTALVGAPWYIRNFYYTHNPVFPFLNSTFLGWFGPARWPAEYRIDLGIAPPSSNPLGWLAALWEAPWKLVFQPNTFFIESRLALPFFCLIPLLLCFAAFRKQVTWWWWLVYTYLVFVFLLAPQMRYLLVILPLAALMAGQTADWLLQWPQWSWLRQRQRWLVGLALLLLLPSWPYATRRLQQAWPAAQVPVTAAQRDAYFSALHSAYGAYQWLNRERSSNYVLYAFGQERLTYFADGVVMGDLFGSAAYRLILENQQNSAALFQVLTRLGAEYFLVDDNPQLKPMARDEFFAAHFKPVFQQGAVVLYQLLP